MRERLEYRSAFGQNPTATISKRSALVGRSDEMDRLDAALTRATAGRGCAVFLSGESGNGKTRLAQEAMAIARVRRFVALQARAYPLDSRLAYSLIVGSLGPFLRAQDDARRGRLTCELPDLGRLFTDLHLPMPEPLNDAALERTRLFGAIARLIERLSQESPVAIFLDDLHWADSASIELLLYLARVLYDQRVLLIATYRSDDADAIRGLRPVLNSLQRNGLSEEIVVRSLDVEAVETMVRSLLGGEVLPEVLKLIVTRTGGTPLFVEALVRFLVSTGRLIHSGGGWGLGVGAAEALPSSIRGLILERIERLDHAARRVLDYIAANGDMVAHDVLQVACGLEDEAFLAGILSLRSAGLVVDEMNEGIVAYYLKHPLIHEVVYAELAEMTRQRAHASFVLALERLHPSNIQQLAHHYRGAGSETNPSRAFNVLVAAGEHAREVYAADQAAQYFSAAVALARRGYGSNLEGIAANQDAADISKRPTVLSWLLDRLGESKKTTGDNDAAVSAWTEALMIYGQLGDGEAVAGLRHQLAFLEIDLGRFDAAATHLEAGLAALAGYPPSQMLADLLYGRVLTLLLSKKLASMPQVVDELTAVANQLESESAEAKAWLGQASLNMVRGHFSEAHEFALRGVAAAERTGKMQLIRHAHNVVASVALVDGDHRSLRQHAEVSLQLSRQLHILPMEPMPRWHLASADLLNGDLAAAEHRCFEAIVLARRVDQQLYLAQALAVRATILALRGDLAEAMSSVAEARDIFAREATVERVTSGLIALGEVTIALEKRDVDALRAIAARFVPISRSTMLNFPPMLALAIGEALVMTGDAESALTLARILAEPGSNNLGYSAALVARVEGQALETLGDGDAAMACQKRAAELFEKLEMAFYAARARLDWAALATRKDPAGAAAAAQGCLLYFQSAGAKLYTRRTQQLLTKLGIHWLPGKRSNQVSLNQATEILQPLSMRELQVARLVADGLTSVEIGKRLAISPRTVTGHLERIYARLGVNSRSALVRYLSDNDLLPSVLNRIR